jgi:hypothetical protein
MTSNLRQILTALTGFLALLGAARSALETGSWPRAQICAARGLACLPK